MSDNRGGSPARRRRTAAGRTGLLVAAGALVLAGCGGDDGPSTAEMLEGVPVEEAIAELGGQCEISGTQGRNNCSAEGVSFQLVHNSWITQAGQRERECQAEQVSLTTQVLTNHSWVIYADQPAELEKLQAGLTEVGAPAQMLGYCEWEIGTGEGG